MSGDEALFTIVSVMLGVVCWGFLLAPVMMTDLRLRRGTALSALLILLPLVSAVVIYPVLATLAARDVRNSPLYTAVYMGAGFGWVGTCMILLRLFTLHTVDMVTQFSPASVLVMFFSTIAFSLAYAGGNVGDGPGWWVVVASATLSSGTVFFVLTVSAMIGRGLYRVTVDQDVGVALRLSGAMVAAGLIAGRGVAGTWASLESLISDWVVISWPVVIIAVFDAVLTKAVSRPDRLWPAFFDAIIAVLYGVAAWLIVAMHGMPI